jgi:elongation factor Ts
MSKPVTPAMIKELRERTGVGMGKCKEALEVANGDMELAISNLRKAGMASAVKKEGRAANEGMIGTAETNKTVAIVEVNAETDFVVRNDRFQDFVHVLAKDAAAAKPHSLEALKQQKFSKDNHHTVEEYRAGLVQAIGENIQIRRVKIIEKANDKSVGIYSHLGGKLVTVVEISGSASEEALAKDIAMHIAAAAPEYLSENDIPESILNHEREIAKSQIKGKPDNIVNKIVDGKLNAYYDATCLTRQKFIKDDAITIADLVNKHAKSSGKSLKVVAFLRWSVGEHVEAHA